jgi:diacylglycerol kinase family enzyme
MRVVVIANTGARALLANRIDIASLVRLFAEAGVQAEVRLVEGPQLSAAAARAASEGVDAVVAAGGDGTVNAVAAGVIGTAAAFGVLPLGTLNHFAKDSHVPMAIADAIATIARGETRRVDVGEVNGRIFLNNSSIGLYPHVVRERDAIRERLGAGKWTAMFLAVVKLMRRFPLMRVRVHTDNACVCPTLTPFVFVGNNEYQMNALHMGARSRLDGGVLSLYMAHVKSRWGMIRLALAALLNRLKQTAPFTTHNTGELRVETRKRRVRVSVDGEVIHLRPPLLYRTLPAALRVLAPTPEAAP